MNYEGITLMATPYFDSQMFLFLLGCLFFAFFLGTKRKRSASVGTVGDTSPASTSASGGKYEVFLSFRGNDTRKSFTDYLYNDLVDAGIRTFRDNEELRVGKEIGPELLKAINESKISIPIFSRDYASSKWCLRELAQMVECQKTMGQKILPIFFDVEPSDVRHQTGSYKKAFRKHKRHFDEKTVQEWQEALRQVGEMKGWELKTETDGHQGKLAKMVSSKVLLELKKNYMVVTDSLVGIDDHVEEMMGLLNVESNDVRIVGIHGMGGIGKTTIAKVIYNQLSERFKSCCFVADVREGSQQHNGLLNLQNQIISKIQKRKCPDIDNVDEGNNMIKDVVRGKKVLIVLDDVDENYQFDKLAGGRDWFGSGSRIIVTTRNKKVLNVLDVDGTYEPHLMKPHHSLQLFSKHAFRMDFPPEDYDILSREVVSTAAGLPLALEIIGSLLFGEVEAVWNDTLLKLKTIPDVQVQKKLRISYDALDYRQKQMFLDIACLFIGMDKTIPSYMWADRKFFPENGINVLVLRSLVKIGDDNEFRMHDQLRDLGREIVLEENFKEPGGRSRLWFPEDALDVLKRQMGTEKVEALCLESQLTTRSQITDGHFRQVPNLRFLRMGGVALVGDFEGLLSELRWLRCHFCPWTAKLNNLNLKNLVIVHLSKNFINDDNGLWSQIKMAKKLKVLILEYCHIFKTTNFSTIATLERLIIKHCFHFVQIGPLIGLSNLQALDLQCKELKSLPNLSNLKNLSTLKLRRCDMLTEIQGLDRLESLEHLKMDECKSIERLPDLSNLKKLSTLNLTSCGNLKEIQGLDRLESLKHLKMSACISIERLSHLSNLKVLKELEFCGLKKLNEIRGLEELESLELLNIGGCKLIEKLPDLSNLKKLKKLKVFGCEKLIEIRGLEELKSLKLLDISGCKSIEKLPDLSNTYIDKNSEEAEKWKRSEFFTFSKAFL